MELRLHQRRVLKDGADIYLTRLEYGAPCYLAASPGHAPRPDCVTEVRRRNTVLVVSGYFKQNTAADKMMKVLDRGA